MGQGGDAARRRDDEMEDEIAASLIEQCSQRGMRTGYVALFRTLATGE